MNSVVDLRNVLEHLHTVPKTLPHNGKNDYDSLCVRAKVSKIEPGRDYK